jgi:hypothetical protein
MVKIVGRSATGLQRQQQIVFALHLFFFPPVFYVAFFVLNTQKDEPRVKLSFLLFPQS